MNARLRKADAMSDENSDERQPKRSYPVGYRKPPAQTRFKKGKSGNPTGRPKGTPNFVSALERALGEQVVVNEGGHRRTITKLEATVAQLVNKAAMGELRATKQLLTVMQALDGEASEVDSVTPTTEADAFVIDHLLERLSSTMKGEHSDDPHT